MGKSSYRAVEANRLKIVIIGAGNVGTFFAQRLDDYADVVQVWSRTFDKAKELASTLRRAKPIELVSDARPDADIYLIAVSDDAIEEVVATMPQVKGIVAHTSGSFSLERFSKICASKKTGVVYPMQTLSKSILDEIEDVPIFIEGKSGSVTSKLVSLARLITNDVVSVSSTMRADLHLAAVFANNFTNYLLDLANRYLKENTKFNISVLEPLLVETIKKAVNMDPFDAQTGPAVRNDSEVINMHVSKLKPEWAELYKYLTYRIIKDHQTLSKPSRTENPIKKNVILASQSPRRRQLLHEIIPQFSIAEPLEVDETYPSDLAAYEVAPYVSLKKAKAYKDSLGDNDLLITADTVVIVDNEILGKPKDSDEALEMLKRLNGRQHEVITGVTLATKDKTETFRALTKVYFDNMNEEELKKYIKDFAPFDKAGAYGIQEWIGSRGIKKIDGCFYNVMGLPLNELYNHLAAF